MVSEGLQGPQAPLEMMAHLAFQAQRDTQGRLATVVFQEREEGQAQMDNLEEREKLERRAGLAPRETWERKAPKETEDLPVMQEKQSSFPERGSLGKLGSQEMMGSQDREVIKEAQGCKGEEEIPEEMEYLDCTEDRLGLMGFLDLLAPLALQAHQD